MQVSIKLFAMDPDRLTYKVGVVSNVCERTLRVHDAAGIPHFMRLHQNERVLDLRHANIPTHEGNVLAVQSMIVPYPVRFNAVSKRSVLLDHRLRIKWIPGSKVGNSIALDGSYMDASGYKYFASTRAATEWMFSYLMPICNKANDYLKDSEELSKAVKEMEAQKMDKLYSAANGDNYGEEFDIPVEVPCPNLWWRSLNDQERYRIYMQHREQK